MLVPCILAGKMHHVLNKHKEERPALWFHEHQQKKNLIFIMWKYVKTHLKNIGQTWLNFPFLHLYVFSLPAPMHFSYDLTLPVVLNFWKVFKILEDYSWASCNYHTPKLWKYIEYILLGKCCNFSGFLGEEFYKLESTWRII